MSITGNVRKGTRLLAGAIGVALVCAAPAVAGPADVTKATAKAAANPLGCTVEHDLSNPFRAWNDTADYALAPAAWPAVTFGYGVIDAEAIRPAMQQLRRSLSR